MSLSILSIVLKTVEIAVLVLGTGLVGYYMKEARDLDQKGLDKPSNTVFDSIDPYDQGVYGRFEFFLYTSSVGVIIAIFGLLVVITGLLEKKGGGLAMVIVNSLWILQLLVSTALLARVLATMEEELNGNQSICKDFDEADRDFQCSQIIGGVVCGFLGAVVFIVDAIVSFVAFQSQSA